MDTTRGLAAAAAATVAAAAVGLLNLVLRAWLVLTRGRSDRSPVPPPGPLAVPVIGSLYTMHGHGDTPFRRFSELAGRYGPVYSMVMGSTRCVVVSDYASIREVLIAKGSLFGGRPDFIRYNVLFAGDRNNCEYIAIHIDVRAHVSDDGVYIRPCYRYAGYCIIMTLRMINRQRIIPVICYLRVHCVRNV